VNELTRELNSFELTRPQHCSLKRTS